MNSIVNITTTQGRKIRERDGPIQITSQSEEKSSGMNDVKNARDWVRRTTHRWMI